jgi:hypothetical protein
MKPRAILALSLVLSLGACSESAPESTSHETVAPSSLPGHEGLAVDDSTKRGPRMVPPEVYLRSYLRLFGGLSPLETQAAARGKDAAQIFDTWSDYLGSLGLPDHAVDVPRTTDTNALMLASFERLGDALCDRAAERDLRSAAPPAQRPVFAFDSPAGPVDRAGFEPRFDVLHRTFLGYPAKLAPPDRVDRMFALYQGTVARHGTGAPVSRLSASEAGWASVCYALVRHPEFHLY